MLVANSFRWYLIQIRRREQVDRGAVVGRSGEASHRRRMSPTGSAGGPVRRTTGAPPALQSGRSIISS